ncbi:MAG: hypothetical protein QGH60_05275 [Phycisphaerae bacterium]|jgi:hypothetical protein|nr:hypothetical protein [Phycisphaerae bacterium]
MKTWKLTHKGHPIEVTNSLFRERLIVDGELQDERTGLGLRSRLSGKIKSGEGSGATIKVSLGGFWVVGCVVFINDTEVFRS